MPRQKCCKNSHCHFLWASIILWMNFSFFYYYIFYEYMHFIASTVEKITSSDCHTTKTKIKKQLIEPGKQNAFIHLKWHRSPKYFLNAFPSRTFHPEYVPYWNVFFDVLFIACMIKKKKTLRRSRFVCKPTNFSLNFNTDHNIVLFFHFLAMHTNQQITRSVISAQHYKNLNLKHWTSKLCGFFFLLHFRSTKFIRSEK